MRDAMIFLQAREPEGKPSQGQRLVVILSTAKDLTPFRLCSLERA
jgi:hypothetical protein